ncbi:MAG: amidophosphoribosyltransferase [bacterium]|nr:amidophosphoribosyltransferase [bacterium]
MSAVTPITIGEACGVFGVFAPGKEAARLAYFGLFALQHRGQESAGIAASDGNAITVYKDLGLVAQVFDEGKLASLTGDIAIGHTRYSTTGSSNWANSQPTYRDLGDSSIALSHNGNLTNTGALAEHLGDQGATTDSELMTELIANEVASCGSLPKAIAAAAPEFEGAFTLTVMDRNTLVGIRDPRGFRPLCLGRLENEGWVLASESAALDIIGANFVREIAPGEMVVINDDGVASLFPFEAADPRMCVFEFVYFARPDSRLYGEEIHSARLRMGELLADQAHVAADIVVPVPESGIPGAQGYAARSGVPYVDGLVKNRYVGRTFIDPSQSMRDRGVRMKLNAMPGILGGKRIVLVDDSIVRGSTTKQLVQMIRDAGATEIHLRILSPPYRWPCYYGMDTGDRSTLLAAGMEVHEIAEFLGVDSLAYLELDALLEATGAPADGFCTACLSGDYPTGVPTTGDKYLLERS